MQLKMLARTGTHGARRRLGAALALALATGCTAPAPRAPDASQVSPEAVPAIVAHEPDSGTRGAGAAHGAGGSVGSPTAGPRAACPDEVCVVPASSAEEACAEGERARLRATGLDQLPDLRCKQVQSAANPRGLAQRAVLLELEDDEMDVPLVLAFGAQDFTHEAQLLSIDDSVGSEGSYRVERFELLDLVPGGAPEIILLLEQQIESWECTSPAPGQRAQKRWLFLCEGGTRCARMLLGSSVRAQAWEGLQHGKFALRLSFEQSSYRLERVSGQVPKVYRNLLGQHAVASLLGALASVPAAQPQGP